MAALEEVNGRPAFNEQKDLRGAINGCETGEGLFDVIVEDVKIFAMKILHESAALVGYDHTDINLIHLNTNGRR